MNKKQKIYLGIGIGILAIAGFYYWKTNKKENKPSSEPSKEPEKKAEPAKNTKGSVPFSKIETTQVKIQPMQPLLTSGVNLTGKKIYSIYDKTTIYSTDGNKIGSTKKNEYMGTVKKVDKMLNGVYWVYFLSPSGKMNKMASNLLNVES